MKGMSTIGRIEPTHNNYDCLQKNVVRKFDSVSGFVQSRGSLMSSTKHNDGRETKRVYALSVPLFVLAVLIAAALFSACGGKSPNGVAVFEADIAGQYWKADSLSIESPGENTFVITGMLRKNNRVIEGFMLGLSGIAAPGEYAIEPPEKSDKVIAVVFKNMLEQESGGYTSVSGTLHVTHLDASGFRGTFRSQAIANSGDRRTIDIDNGRIDVVFPDFEALRREQEKLLVGMWKGDNYKRSWVISKKDVRGAVYNPQNDRWLINKSVLEFAGDGTYKPLHEKKKYTWRVVRSGMLSVDRILCRFTVTPTRLEILNPGSKKIEGYTRIHELPGLE